jgi:RNA polymerase sigma-70 factor (ECF subfamily)
MQIELSPDDVETIIHEADAAAQRLRRKLTLPVCEREDLGQDLLVDLLRRLPAYDPSRGFRPRIAGSARRWRIAPSARWRPRVSAAGPRSTAASPISATSSPPTVSVPPGTISLRPE